MTDEEFISVPVPKSQVLAVYRFLTGVAGPVMAAARTGDGLVTDPAIVTRAYLESPPAMKRFLGLLAAHPDEWLTISEVRDALGFKLHQLPGILGAFQRRWQGRYRQSGRWPFDADDATGVWRYRMPAVNAELIASLG